jgi:hypothetical protein
MKVSNAADLIALARRSPTEAKQQLTTAANELRARGDVKSAKAIESMLAGTQNLVEVLEKKWGKAGGVLPPAAQAFAEISRHAATSSVGWSASDSPASVNARVADALLSKDSKAYEALAQAVTPFESLASRLHAVKGPDMALLVPEVRNALFSWTDRLMRGEKLSPDDMQREEMAQVASAERGAEHVVNVGAGTDRAAYAAAKGYSGPREEAVAQMLTHLFIELHDWARAREGATMENLLKSPAAQEGAQKLAQALLESPDRDRELSFADRRGIVHPFAKALPLYR